MSVRDRERDGQQMAEMDTSGTSGTQAVAGRLVGKFEDYECTYDELFCHLASEGDGGVKASIEKLPYPSVLEPTTAMVVHDHSGRRKLAWTACRCMFDQLPAPAFLFCKGGSKVGLGYCKHMLSDGDAYGALRLKREALRRRFARVSQSEGSEDEFFAGIATLQETHQLQQAASSAQKPLLLEESGHEPVKGNDLYQDMRISIGADGYGIASFILAASMLQLEHAGEPEYYDLDDDGQSIAHTQA